MTDTQIPDATTRPQRARQVVIQLRHVQVQLYDLALVKDIDELEDTAPMTWLPPVGEEDGQPLFKTIGEERARLEGVIARLWGRVDTEGMTRLVRAMIAADAAAAEVEAAQLEEAPSSTTGEEHGSDADHHV